MLLIKKIIKHFYNIKTRREQLLFIEVCMYFEFIVTGFIYFVIFFFSPFLECDEQRVIKTEPPS